MDSLRPTVSNVTNWFLKVTQSLLALRLIFELFGANMSTGFVSWVYEMTNPLLYPLRNLVPTQAHSTRYVLDVTVLGAMVLYGLVAVVVMKVANWAAVPAKRR